MYLLNILANQYQADEIVCQEIHSLDKIVQLNLLNML
jgi:hypothetical protein